MKKMILTIIICFALFFSLGLVVGKNVFKEEKKEAEKKVEEVKKDKNGFVEGFKISGYSIVDDYYIVSGYATEEEDYANYMYIYDEFAQLKKELKNASYMKKIEIGNKVAYQVDVELGRGGAHSTTYILNENLEVIVETADLPEKNEGMDSDLFTAHYNSNGTISIMINDVYVYDYEGNLIKTIENKNGSIKAVARDYYFLNESGKINLVRYDNDERVLVTNKKNSDIIYSPMSGSAPLMNWDEENELNVFIITGEDSENAVCTIYSYAEKSGKLVLVGTEPIECI